MFASRDEAVASEANVYCPIKAAFADPMAQASVQNSTNSCFLILPDLLIIGGQGFCLLRLTIGILRKLVKPIRASFCDEREESRASTDKVGLANASIFSGLRRVCLPPLRKFSNKRSYEQRLQSNSERTRQRRPGLLPVEAF